jgi:glycosyltransferase involved in cell wall biosynthesis
VHVVPGRVDVRRWHPRDAAGLRKAWGVAPNEVLFGIVSRIKPERLHGVVLRAFARVALEAPGRSWRSSAGASTSPQCASWPPASGWTAA